MKFYKFTLTTAILAALGLGSCQQEESIVKKEDIPQQTLDKIYQLGFGTRDVQKVEKGYLVEGDILLTDAQLNEQVNGQLLRVGKTEQYHTTNLVSVTSSPRVIKVSVARNLPSSYVSAMEQALARYNAEGLRLTFTLVNSGAHISLTKAPATANYLASAGFPSKGNPYNNIEINANYLGATPDANYLATILAHELGHCIGFRHTDFMDRSFSCGGSAVNEGASSVGAIHIPETPATAEVESWMLACIGSGANRPFTANDKTALGHLY